MRCQSHVSATAQAQPGVLVYPGMEIHQDSVLCTLGYVDHQTRMAYTAGHCRASGTVSDKQGNVIGTQGLFSDNTPDGTTIDTNHQIADWEVVHLNPDVVINVSDALAAISEDRFDVLIADLNIGMPGDGFTVVSAMRRTQPEAVTIILTGYPAFETALEAIRSQVDDYAVKPANIERMEENCTALNPIRRRT